MSLLIFSDYVALSLIRAILVIGLTVTASEFTPFFVTITALVDEMVSIKSI
jgi:hypothetical protein